MMDITNLARSHFANVLMFLIIVGTGLFASVGLFNFLAHLVKLPSAQATKAIVKVSKAKGKNQSTDAFFFDMASKIMPYIRMDDYRKKKYVSTLLSAGISLTPEMYLALAYVKTLFFLLPGIIFFTFKGIFPDAIENIFAIIGAVLMVLSVITCIKSISEANEKAKKRKEEIEGDLPRLVANIVEEVKSTRDIKQMLESYMRYNKSVLSDELFITQSDISSGNVEIALTRLESRIGSNLLSQVVRGLIGIHRGDDGLSYFNNLNRDFKGIELQRLKKMALTKPPKIRRCSFFLLIAMMATMLGIIGSAALESASALF